MSDNSIPKQVLNSLGQIIVETGKEAVKQVSEITTGIITGKELLGINEMSDADLQKKKMEEEKKKQKELSDLRSQMSGGRNLDVEIKQIRDEKEQLEQQKLREEQEKAQQSRPEQIVIEPAGKPARGKMGGGQKKKQKPTDDQMTATGEFKGKVD